MEVMVDVLNTDSPEKDNKEFSYYWDLFVIDVVARENFKRGHLEQLRILCSLYTEFDDLTNQIRENGYSYSADTRNGLQVKVNVEVTVREKVLGYIVQYSKMLGLILEKDIIKNKKDGTDDWS